MRDLVTYYLPMIDNAVHDRLLRICERAKRGEKQIISVYQAGHTSLNCFAGPYRK